MFGYLNTVSRFLTNFYEQSLERRELQNSLRVSVETWILSVDSDNMHLEQLSYQIEGIQVSKLMQHVRCKLQENSGKKP